jgi:serine/threonine protein kinase
MAPEHFEKSASVDHRADLFALGGMFYEMLTGERPQGMFKPPSHKAKMDPRLDPVVFKSRAREPELRFQSASETKAHLGALGNRSPAESEVKEDEAFSAAGIYPVMFGMVAVVLWVDARTDFTAHDLTLAKSVKKCLLPIVLSLCWIITTALKRKGVSGSG